MICPHCNTGVRLEFEDGSGAYQSKEDRSIEIGREVAWDQCPECENLIVLLKIGLYVEHNTEYMTYRSVSEVQKEQLLYPTYTIRQVANEVPEVYKKEFLETSAVLAISPKASAAISRRLLQNVLRAESDIQHSNLAQEIEEFIKLDGVPLYLSNAVDAIRNVGNLAAHPLKDKETGTILDVESGEAEWLLEVIEALFDFVFVQPKKLKERQESLNEKLKAIGKPPMKVKIESNKEEKS